MKTPKPLYRPGDVLTVEAEVITGPTGRPAMSFPFVGPGGGQLVVPLDSRLTVTGHQRAVREGDKVKFPGSTPGEFGRVTFLLDGGGVVQPRDCERQSTFACVVVDDAPPRIIRTDQLDRQDD